VQFAGLWRGMHPEPGPDSPALAGSNRFPEPVTQTDNRDSPGIRLEKVKNR
jgi:hypothetical protein